MGCVGDDDFAAKMAATAAADGVTARYMVDKAAPTGTCAVCIVGGERSLVANLAAANNFKSDFLAQKENWALVEAARVRSARFCFFEEGGPAREGGTHCAAAPHRRQEQSNKICRLETTPTNPRSIAIKTDPRPHHTDHQSYVQPPPPPPPPNDIQVIYSAGFFITVSPESIMAAAKHCAENDKVYCMNISAPFIVQVMG